MPVKQTFSDLPIESVLGDICHQLSQCPNLLLLAEPGAGKTTRVPLALLEQDWLADKTIIMLEPRRLAARNAATYMASQLGEAVGERVGYRIRFENRTSEHTRILVVTEGILTRMLQQDPELAGVGLIIFDEFHERHLHSDLALALSHQCQQLLRDDLKLLLMSATLDSDRLSALLDAPVLQCPGRGYPVETIYRPRQSGHEPLLDQCRRVILDALNTPGQDGHILVFLPGTRDIQRLQQALRSLPDPIHALPLHGRLTDREQKQALAPVANGERKVILSTNIAESSLTLDGVRIVIDSGLEKRLTFNPNNGISQLVSRRISQASSIQRQGRAGRQAPGVCYRLWPEGEQSRLTAHIEAEISQTDLSHLLLELLQWGASADELLWLTPPPASSMAHAHALLKQLGLINDQHQLTESGQQCSQLGLEPRWASALLAAQRAGFAQQACELVALLQTGAVPLKSDDIERLWLASRHPDKHLQSRLQHQVAPLARRWRRRLPSTLPPSSPLPSPLPSSQSDQTTLDIGWLLANAWPDRIARQRAGQDSLRYQLSNGSGASLMPNSPLQGEAFLVVVDTSEATIDNHTHTLIRSAVALTEAHLQPLSEHIPGLLSEHIRIEWQDNGALLAESQRYLGQWVWQRKKLHQLSQEQWQQAWDDWFSQPQGLASLHQDDSSAQLQTRMMLVKEHLEPDWPDVSQQGLIQRRSEWLLPWLNDVRHQKALKKLKFSELLLNQLSWEQQQRLNTLAPTHWQVASGSRIALDYCQQPPVLAVKLQELFGYEAQPAILNGQLPLMIHLLSPAKRPVQITQDLPHFWRNSYEAVRKDLRGKYPKHPWPEDPLSAEATRLTNRAIKARQTRNG